MRIGIALTVGAFLTAPHAASPRASAGLFKSSSPLTALPDDPCALLTLAEMATVARLDVISMTRAPSIEQAVVADREHRAPDAGEICVYETRSAFGEINVSVPRRAKRTAEAYWSDRSRSFQRDRLA